MIKGKEHDLHTLIKLGSSQKNQQNKHKVLVSLILHELRGAIQHALLDHPWLSLVPLMSVPPSDLPNSDQNLSIHNKIVNTYRPYIHCFLDFPSLNGTRVKHN